MSLLWRICMWPVRWVGVPAQEAVVAYVDEDEYDVLVQLVLEACECRRRSSPVMLCARYPVCVYEIDPVDGASVFIR